MHIFYQLPWNQHLINQQQAQRLLFPHFCTNTMDPQRQDPGTGRSQKQWIKWLSVLTPTLFPALKQGPAPLLRIFIISLS